ncbi:Cell fate regulator YaaT, PSP1 superfamily (controls sporulation, competence, biofilm development) [Natronincola peptidivorans]|uniref:Cell fate regulator YaaT, PSP1 superfamily (Controls sporulation, competence, biofilm development) n=1 Tax=Natronincola peptidivorans TaxID=426128 RepID=A0A1I0CUS4_9FIRM|nr:stage 0 sporulation family protein [Natronincola peptidivorans]SET23557.1 Cell fate regulator YaaT, PSP1 superfamily (controls sporulation, competence, biofilm development) [Natronincola peptidivorans]
MVTVVGIRFKKAGKIYYFNPGEIPVKKDQHVIVETARGVEFGEVVVGPKEVAEEHIVAPLKDVIRIVTKEDQERHAENKQKEKDALEICLEKIESHELEMKLIDVEYTFDNNKVIFYFTADGRVDFRELVKDLAAIFKTRIELRQIGVRDEAKMLGGIGTCGKPLCCSSWLGDFEPVSIKMAKEQSLSLNPTKISGICGRLFCCLKYEHDMYQEILDKLPGIGSVVQTPYGEGTVIETNVILERVKVKIKNQKDNTEELKICSMTEVTKIKEKRSLKEQLETKAVIDEGLSEDELKQLED